MCGLWTRKAPCDFSSRVTNGRAGRRISYGSSMIALMWLQHGSLPDRQGLLYCTALLRLWPPRPQPAPARSLSSQTPGRYAPATTRSHRIYPPQCRHDLVVDERHCRPSRKPAALIALHHRGLFHMVSSRKFRGTGCPETSLSEPSSTHDRYYLGQCPELDERLGEGSWLYLRYLFVSFDREKERRRGASGRGEPAFDGGRLLAASFIATPMQQ